MITKNRRVSRDSLYCVKTNPFQYEMNYNITVESSSFYTHLPVAAQWNLAVWFSFTVKIDGKTKTCGDLPCWSSGLCDWPGIPWIPFSPFCPLTPATPETPVTPWSPLSPLVPGSPGGPWRHRWNARGKNGVSDKPSSWISILYCSKNFDEILKCDHSDEC